MAESKFIYYNADGVTRTLVHDTEKPQEVKVNTEVDYTSLVDTNRALAENQRPGSTNKLVARAPLTVYEQSVREGWDDNDWKRWLNDPDNKAFRVWEGRV